MVDPGDHGRRRVPCGEVARDVGGCFPRCQVGARIVSLKGHQTTPMAKGAQEDWLCSKPSDSPAICANSARTSSSSWPARSGSSSSGRSPRPAGTWGRTSVSSRSEERRVGKEWRSRWSPEQEKKKKGVGAGKLVAEKRSSMHEWQMRLNTHT